MGMVVILFNGAEQFEEIVNTGMDNVAAGKAGVNRRR